MKQVEFTIIDPIGIHARPAGQLCKAVGGLGSSVKIATDKKEADARRMMAVMGLGVKGGDTVTFKVEGATEEEDAAKLEGILKEIGLI